MTLTTLFEFTSFNRHPVCVDTDHCEHGHPRWPSQSALCHSPRLVRHYVFLLCDWHFVGICWRSLLHKAWSWGISIWFRERRKLLTNLFSAGLHEFCKLGHRFLSLCVLHYIAERGGLLCRRGWLLWPCLWPQRHLRHIYDRPLVLCLNWPRSLPIIQRPSITSHISAIQNTSQKL